MAQNRNLALPQLSHQPPPHNIEQNAPEQKKDRLGYGLLVCAAVLAINCMPASATCAAGMLTA